MNKHPVTVATFIDEYEEHRIIHRRRNGILRVAKRKIAPIVALSSAVGRFAGKQIRAARQSAGLTMEQLSVKAGITGGKNRVYEIERGMDGGLRTGTIYAIAHALGIPPCALLPTTAQAMQDAGVILETEDVPVVGPIVQRVG